MNCDLNSPARGDRDRRHRLSEDADGYVRHRDEPARRVVQPREPGREFTDPRICVKSSTAASETLPGPKAQTGAISARQREVLAEMSCDQGEPHMDPDRRRGNFLCLGALA
jgi:hypothetical protein